jgi:hypothetical protein
MIPITKAIPNHRIIIAPRPSVRAIPSVVRKEITQEEKSNPLLLDGTGYATDDPIVAGAPHFQQATAPSGNDVPQV